jgi:hypothetical protein
VGDVTELEMDRSLRAILTSGQVTMFWHLTGRSSQKAGLTKPLPLIYQNAYFEILQNQTGAVTKAAQKQDPVVSATSYCATQEDLFVCDPVKKSHTCVSLLYLMTVKEC